MMLEKKFFRVRWSRWQKGRLGHRNQKGTFPLPRPASRYGGLPAESRFRRVTITNDSASFKQDSIGKLANKVLVKFSF